MKKTRLTTETRNGIHGQPKQLIGIEGEFKQTTLMLHRILRKTTAEKALRQFQTSHF